MGWADMLAGGRLIPALTGNSGKTWYFVPYKAVNPRTHGEQPIGGYR